MANVRFLKDPGFLYDLFFLFVLRFNKETCLKNYVNRNTSEEDLTYYKNLAEEASEVSDGLLPFFYLRKDNLCFMTMYYFRDLVSKDIESCGFDTVQKELKKPEQIVTQMMRFYFPELSDKQLAACRESFVEISRMIHKSVYPAEVKSSLYSFFLYPEQSVQQLAYDMLAVKQTLSQRYERNYEKVLELYQQFDYEKVTSVLASTTNQTFDFTEFAEICVSFCQCNKNCLKLYTSTTVPVLILGKDYKAILTELQSQNERPELDLLGTILSERNRIELLDMMAKKGEVTIRDIESELNIVGTNAYYHLSMMLRVGMVKTRNRGRTLLYSLSGEYFTSVSNALLQYANK
ncbi:MAG: winged helix-turn-helix transcriptional regulator [Ruminococcaceae bacterium]|nr:winged helix-turn-helix transcriptional regulator [Oscillospiraceae bacterium]